MFPGSTGVNLVFKFTELTLEIDVSRRVDAQNGENKDPPC